MSDIDTTIILAALLIVVSFGLFVHIATKKIVEAIRQVETTAEYLAAKNKL